MAKVEPVQRVQFNWLNFLWENLAYIRGTQREGRVVNALEHLISLIWYCPVAIKKQFEEKADKIQRHMDKLSQKEGVSLLETSQLRTRRLTVYASRVYPQLIREFTSALDKAGYMERRSMIPEGLSHTLRT